MSLDGFLGLDDNDKGALSPDKVREFKARMARNKQLMAAAHQQEQRQKKKEDKLFLILLKFIQANKRSDITLLISRCLEQNIPAVFILTVILLGNEEIQDEMGIRLDLLPGPERVETDQPIESSLAELQDPEMKGALVVFGEDHSFPLKMRIAIDLWGKNIFEAATPIPERILKTVPEWNDDPSVMKEPKEVVTQLTTFILRDYLEENGVKTAYENLHSFAEFFLKGVLKRLIDQLKDQKQLW